MTDVFDDLNRITMATIGDAITYTPSGGSATPLKGWADHSGDTISYGFSEAVTAGAVVQVNKTDVATVSKLDVFYLPETGLSYNPVETLTSRCGRMWNVALGKVAPV